MESFVKGVNVIKAAKNLNAMKVVGKTLQNNQDRGVSTYSGGSGDVSGLPGIKDIPINIHLKQPDIGGIVTADNVMKARADMLGVKNFGLSGHAKSSDIGTGVPVHTGNSININIVRSLQDEAPQCLDIQAFSRFSNDNSYTNGVPFGMSGAEKVVCGLQDEEDNTQGDKTDVVDANTDGDYCNAVNDLKADDGLTELPSLQADVYSSLLNENEDIQEDAGLCSKIVGEDCDVAKDSFDVGYGSGLEELSLLEPEIRSVLLDKEDAQCCGLNGVFDVTLNPGIVSRFDASDLGLPELEPVVTTIATDHVIDIHAQHPLKTTRFNSCVRNLNACFSGVRSFFALLGDLLRRAYVYFASAIGSFLNSVLGQLALLFDEAFSAVCRFCEAVRENLHEVPLKIAMTVITVVIILCIVRPSTRSEKSERERRHNKYY